MASDSATTKFQSALPVSLLSISPSLSALHAYRARTLNPDEFDSSSPMYCLQCGSYLLAVNGSLELHRPRRRRKTTDNKSNTLKSTCHRCGFISYTSFEASRHIPKPTADIPSISDHKPEEEKIPSSSRSSAPVASSSPVANSTRGNTPVLHPKPKKKTILQEMLTRNRQEEAGRMKSQKKASQSGLASFLSSL